MNERIRIYLDEAVNLALLGMPESLAMAETTKMDLTFCVITQTARFGDDVIDDNIDQNCPRKLLFHSEASGAELGAKNLMTRLDPHLALDVTERQLVDGYTEIEREVADESFDADGKLVRKGKRKQYSSQPRHRTVKDTKFQALGDQQTMQVVEVMKLGLGDYFDVNAGVVEGPLHAEKVEDFGGIPGYGRARLEEVLEELRCTSLYRKPRPEEPEPPPPVPAPKQPRKKTAAKSLKPRRGTR